MSPRPAFALALAAVVLFASLFPSPVASAESLIVGAAASLQDAMEEIARAFEEGREEARDVTVRVTYAGSGRLRKQIEAGAPVDVFLTARSAMLDEMVREGTISGSTKFATNALVVIVPAGSADAPKALADLTRTRYLRIGLGNPGYVPAGTYAKTALEAAGAYDGLKARLVYGENVRQVLAYASRGEVDAAIVYRTDAEGRNDVRVAFALSEEAGVAVTYGGGINAGAPRSRRAAEFLEFLKGDAAKLILKRHGFGVPD